MGSAKERDCPSTRGVALIGHLVPVSFVVDEFRVVGVGMKVGDVEQKVAQWKSPSNGSVFGEAHTEPCACCT